MNANDLKDQGNMYFACRKFNDAVSCYTKAIVSSIVLALWAQAVASVRTSVLSSREPTKHSVM